MSQQKLELLLEIMLYLSSGLRYSIEEIANRFEISVRTAYRYIETFRNAGFIIPQPQNGLYFIDKNSPQFKEISALLHFSKEEATILYKAIDSIDDENILKGNLRKKLYALYDFDRIPETLVNKQYAQNVHLVIKAIKEKKKIALKGYYSARGSRKGDRIVEPFDITTNYVAVWAYDPKDDQCKTFKMARISEVQILPDACVSEDKHVKQPMDVFRIGSFDQTEVKLNLSIRATRLLLEEYPSADSLVTQIDDKTYQFVGKVCSFEGVGRFVLGLYDEIEIVYPTDLKLFLNKKFDNDSTSS